MSDTQDKHQMISPSNCKFRISLSLPQIDWILENCKGDFPDLYSQLTLIKFKAETGMTTPAYALTPRVPKTKPPKPQKQMTLQEKYNVALSLMGRGMELGEYKEAYDEFRYLNDLMSPPEMEAYEKEALGDLE